MRKISSFSRVWWPILHFGDLRHYILTFFAVCSYCYGEALPTFIATLKHVSEQEARNMTLVEGRSIADSKREVTGNAVHKRVDSDCPLC